MADQLRIVLPGTVFPFMPSADKFIEYLGMSGGLAGVINEIGTRLGQPLPDPKTVRKAVKKGVSPRSFDQIKSILDSACTPEMHDYIAGPYLAPWMETTLHQNGLAWLSMVRGYHLKIFPADQPQTFTEQFVKRRAEQELELLKIGLEIHNNAETTVFVDRWGETLNDFLPRHTGVEPTHIERGLEAWKALKTGEDQSYKEQVGLLLGLYTRLRIDFYYQLLCNISLDLIRWFKEKGSLGDHEGQWLIRNGFFGDMVPAFDGDSLIMPFESSLDTWRKGAGADGNDLSWTKIAAHLPDPYGLDENSSRSRNQTIEERIERIRENKKSRLREWRKGTRPEPQQLNQFVRNLTPLEDDVPLVTMRLDVACTWGAFLLDELATFKKYGLIGALHETLPAFECYPAYWADYQSQAAQIVAA